MSTLALTASGDLDFSTGNLVVVRDRAQALAQKLQSRFRMFLGEWFLGVNQGIPYHQVVLATKSPDLGIIRQLFRDVIASTPGVKSLDQFVLDFNDRTRVLAFSFRATSDEDAVITGGSGTPFIVETK